MSLWSRLRDLRYAAPEAVGRHMPAPDADWARDRAHALQRQGMQASFGHFHRAQETPDAVLAAMLALGTELRGSGAWLAVKAAALGFDAARIGQLAGLPLMFDSHAPEQADATLDLAMGIPGAGCAIPARWRRSMDDALRLRDTPMPLRIVKGEWADPHGDPEDVRGAYLDLVRALAGRRAPVGIASHDPVLVAAALDLLADTPCVLEQLRGLPRRRTMALARARGAPVRIYNPTGPGWWPYAIDKALARTYLPGWWWRDLWGRAD